MNAMTHDLFLRQPEGPSAADSDAAAQWAALCGAADALSFMVDRHSGTSKSRGLAISGTSIDENPLAATPVLRDLCAMMEQGLFAILKAREQGADATIAAGTLLSRFERECAILFRCEQSSGCE